MMVNCISFNRVEVFEQKTKSVTMVFKFCFLFLAVLTWTSVAAYPDGKEVEKNGQLIISNVVRINAKNFLLLFARRTSFYRGLFLYVMHHHMHITVFFSELRLCSRLCVFFHI